MMINDPYHVVAQLWVMGRSAQCFAHPLGYIVLLLPCTFTQLHLDIVCQSVWHWRGVDKLDKQLLL